MTEYDSPRDQLYTLSLSERLLSTQSKITDTNTCEEEHEELFVTERIM